MRASPARKAAGGTCTGRDELVSQARTGGGAGPAPVGWSGVNWPAGPGIEAQRLHDGERGGGGEDLDVRGGQHAGVLRDDGRSGAFGDRVEVALHSGPEVLAVPH